MSRRQFTISSLATAGLALTGCGQAGAHVLGQEGSHREGTTESGTRYRVSLPPEYDSSPEERYSVLIHLHGATLSWIGLHGDVEVVASAATAAVEVGVLDPMIIVAPHDDGGWSMWADSHDGSVDVASQILNELIPDIDANYRTWPVPECRAIQGFSMGGFGAATMLFKHPELFGAGIVWDGAMHDWPSLQVNRPTIAANHFGDSEAAFDGWSPWTTAASHPSPPPPLMIVRGAMTNFYDRYTEHLDDLGHKPVLVETSCGHDIACLTETAGGQAMAFLAQLMTQTAN